jgi:membrane protease YdiL (CAAX protease family)
MNLTKKNIKKKKNSKSREEANRNLSHIRIPFLIILSLISIVSFPVNWTFTQKSFFVFLIFLFLIMIVEMNYPNLILLSKDVILGILSAVLIFPVLEELIFRHFLLQFLQKAEFNLKYLNIIFSVLMSALIFTGFHFSNKKVTSKEFVYYFIYGIIFGTAFVLSGYAILVPILLHSCSNLWEITVKFRKFKKENKISTKKFL